MRYNHTVRLHESETRSYTSVHHATVQLPSAIHFHRMNEILTAPGVQKTWWSKGALAADYLPSDIVRHDIQAGLKRKLKIHALVHAQKRDFSFMKIKQYFCYQTFFAPLQIVLWLINTDCLINEEAKTRLPTLQTQIPRKLSKILSKQSTLVRGVLPAPHRSPGTPV